MIYDKPKEAALYEAIMCSLEWDNPNPHKRQFYYDSMIYAIERLDLYTELQEEYRISGLIHKIQMQLKKNKLIKHIEFMYSKEYELSMLEQELKELEQNE